MRAHLRGVGDSSDADLALLALHPLQTPIDERNASPRDAGDGLSGERRRGPGASDGGDERGLERRRGPGGSADGARLRLGRHSGERRNSGAARQERGCAC